jgi:hypothetical protein
VLLPRSMVARRTPQYTNAPPAVASGASSNEPEGADYFFCSVRM